VALSGASRTSPLDSSPSTRVDEGDGSDTRLVEQTTLGPAAVPYIPDALMTDVEGREFDVLRGGQQVIACDPTALIIRVNDSVDGTVQLLYLTREPWLHDPKDRVLTPTARVLYSKMISMTDTNSRVRMCSRQLTRRRFIERH
jgi:hypothetical protein